MKGITILSPNGANINKKTHLESILSYLEGGILKMKRFLALIAASIMVLGACLVVSAAPSSDSVSGNSISGSSADSKDEVEYDAASEAFALEIQATGVSSQVYFAAEDENKTIGEYISNSVVEVPGLDVVTPVGQGGKIVLDGESSNVNFSVQKPLRAYVDSAKAQAAALGGNILNVVNIQANVSFGTASVNFYMPGVTAGQNIQVYQYADGQWTNVNVSEIRDDHVVVDMTSLGVLAFIQIQ